MLTTSGTPMSCGLRLIHGESYYKTAEAFIKDFAVLNYGKNGQSLQQASTNGTMWSQRPLADYTQFVFSHRESLPIGKLIKNYIETHGLGSVSESASGNNPVHGNPAHPHNIIVWVWTRDNEAFRKHAQEILAVPQPIDAALKPTVA